MFRPLLPILMEVLDKENFIMAGYVKMCNSEVEIKMLKWLKRI